MQGNWNLRSNITKKAERKKPGIKVEATLEVGGKVYDYCGVEIKPLDSTLKAMPEAELIPLDKFLKNLEKSKNDVRRKVVLIATGAFCPLHTMHVRMLELAKEYLETEHHMNILAGFLSPSHDSYVAPKLRHQGTTFIEAVHRVAMIKEVTKNSSWISQFAWEVAQPSFMDFPSVVQKLESIIDKRCSNVEVFYTCGADLAWHSKLYKGKSYYPFGIVAMGRSGEYIKFKNVTFGLDFYLVEKEMRDLSSTEMRTRIMKGQSIDDLTFVEVIQYLKNNNIKIEAVNT